MKRKQDYYSAYDLKERGWTETAIKKFLKEPDNFLRNPRYSTSAQKRQWEKLKVHRAEENPEFQEWKSKLEKRRKAGKQASVTKRKNLILKAEQFNFEIKSFKSKEALWREVVRFMNYDLSADEFYERNFNREYADVGYTSEDVLSYYAKIYLRKEARLNTILEFPKNDSEINYILEGRLEKNIFDIYPFLVE